MKKINIINTSSLCIAYHFLLATPLASRIQILSELSVLRTCSWQGWIVFFKLWKKLRDFIWFPYDILTLKYIYIPIAPSITLFSVGTGNVDVAGRPGDLQAVFFAEDGLVELLDADITRFGRWQIHRLDGVLGRRWRSSGSTEERFVRARRPQSRQAQSVQTCPHHQTKRVI